MYKEADKLFGEMIRKARSERKITQEKLSEMTDISVTYCRYIEKGKYTCSWIIWLKLCKELGIDLNDVYNICLKDLQEQ